MAQKQTEWRLPIAGGILLILPIFFLVRWISISNKGQLSHEEAVAQFSSIFPGFLQDPLVSTILVFVFSAAATVAGFLALGRAKGLFFWICLFETGLGGLLSLWFLFSLM